MLHTTQAIRRMKMAGLFRRGRLSSRGNATSILMTIAVAAAVVLWALLGFEFAQSSNLGIVPSITIRRFRNATQQESGIDVGLSLRSDYSSRISGLFRGEGLETFGCAERRDIQGVSNNLMMMSLRSRLEPTNETDICIVYNRTRTQDCMATLGELGEASVKLNSEIFYDSIYNTSLTGCQIRSAFLEMFAADSWLHFEGDSIMRQFWIRLICMIRDLDVCIDPASKACAVYALNLTDDYFSGQAMSWDDISDDARMNNGIVMSYCFTTSPTLSVLDESQDSTKNIALLTFGVFYWPVVSTFEKWINNKESLLASRIPKAKLLMNIERIPSRWKFDSEINGQVMAFLRNNTDPKRVGQIPWNSLIAPKRPSDVVPVDPLHWMCRWRVGEDLVTGNSYQCFDRENQAVVISYLHELMILNSQSS